MTPECRVRLLAVTGLQLQLAVLPPGLQVRAVLVLVQGQVQEQMPQAPVQQRQEQEPTFLAQLQLWLQAR
jgi:hypothetical protein